MQSCNEEGDFAKEELEERAALECGDSSTPVKMANLSKAASEPSEEESGADEPESTRTKSSYVQIPYGFQSRGTYRHASKNCEIGGVTYNSRQRQFVILDSRGITSWSFESVTNTVARHMNYPAYQFNVLRLIIYSRKFNVYFTLSKEYALKVFNMNFHEVFSVSAEMHSVLCMVFNPVRNELITGGTGGMKFWTFGERKSDRRKNWDRDSRPMANYGLVLRAEYPDMGGSWVKQVELDEVMQRLYCLSERHVVAYDMMGNQLFQIIEAHRGPVTGCVYSKACNFLVTAGNDCDVNVWSGNCRKVHTFTGHTKVITKIMVHPETSCLIFTASLDGHVKVYSLDIMEEIYSLPVHPEGIIWMETVSSKVFYCCSYRVVEVFAINHVTDFWALTRCSLKSLSLVGSEGKSTRVMAVSEDSSVRLFSRKGQKLTTVLPPPPISPLQQVLDVAYNRETGMMYLLVSDSEIWVYYTRTNPATRLEAWELDLIEDAHFQQSQDMLGRSRPGTSWAREASSLSQTSAHRSSSPFFGPSRTGTPWEEGPSRLSPGSPSESMLHSRGERVQCSSLGMLYSHIIMDSVEGEACPDMTSFLMTGLQDGRVLFLNMYCKGLKYSQLQAHKDAVLSVKHDQETNTLVTKCKSFHGTLVLQIWSLPYLDLQQQVTCDGDLACFVRMDHLLMSGYDSGYLKLQLLGREGCDTCTYLASEEKATEFKRTPPKDHQMAVCSVDASKPLGIFCSTSKDGYLKIWDKEKTLLREIVFDNTLNVACFLNFHGDLLIGYKHQLFIISHNKVYPLKERTVGEHGISLDEDAFETESDIYEDPSVKYESKKILQPDPTNMENYLVPFPNLHLSTSWFMDMEGRAPPELNQDQQQQEEVASLFSDDLSLAPTEIYLSPGSTPRTLSLASLPVLEERLARVAQERKRCQDLWHLPDFGVSPVSSPPRTPPPEPNPPSSPSMGGESEEENAGEKGQFVDQKLDDQSPCKTCEVDIKKDVKKAPNLAIFKREGGRLGNVKVDSSALRLAARSGGYAAPIVRTVTVQKPEPKPFKPRRPPRPIAKKTRKPKPEDPAKKTDDASKDKPLEEQQAQQNQQDGSAQAHSAETTTQNLNSSHHNPDGSMRDVAPKDGEKTGQESAKGQWAPTGPARNRPLFGGPQNETPGVGVSVSHQSPDGGRTGVKSEGEHVDGNDNPQYSESAGFIDLRSRPGRGLSQGADSGPTGEGKEVTATGQTSHDAPGPDDPRDQAPGSRMVSYVDPESGELVKSAINEVPDGAEIIEEFGEEEEEEAFEEDEDAPSRTSLKRDRDLGKSKTVSFKVDRKGRVLNSGNRRAHSAEGTQGGSGRFWSRTSHTRSTVMPLYEPQTEGRFETRKSKSDMSVSPLTIFALARNRRHNANKLDKNPRDLSPTTQTSAQPQVYQSFSVQGYKDMSSHIGWERDADSVTEFVESAHVNETAESGFEGAQAAQRSESDMMSWCIRALKKSSPALLLPQKPTRSRPQSSPSRSGEAKSRTEGETLYLNYGQEGGRPKTAESLNTVDTSRSNEEYTMYPYMASPPPTPELREETTTSRGAHSDRHKSRVRGLRVKHRLNKTRGQSSDDEDLDEMCCNIEASLTAYSSDLRINYKRSLRSCSLSDNESSILRPIPPLDVNDYSENWHEKLIERAHLLKQQRLERHKSAVERRHRLEDKQRQRWRHSGHYACAQESSSQAEKTIEFLPPSSHSATETAAGKLERYPPQSPNLKEQELSSERPFRLRLNLQQEENRLTPAARGLISLRSSEHNVSDVVSALPRPNSAISIPSKCNRYVLVTGEQKPAEPKLTPLEKSLLMLRFPKSPTRRRYQPEGSVTRPGSTQDIYAGVT